MKFNIIVFIVLSYMVLVRVSILFNGEWIKQNDEYKFKSSKAKGIMIPRSTTYAELVEKIAEVIDIDTSEFEITMKFNLCHQLQFKPIMMWNFFRFQFNFTCFFLIIFVDIL